MDVEFLRIFRPGSTPLVSLTYITSLAILLGTPVWLFVNLSLTQISNHTAAVQYTQACRHGQADLLKLKLSIRMEKKGNLSDFKITMVLGARFPANLL